eukprot:PRCOL_00000614-RA
MGSEAVDFLREPVGLSDGSIGVAFARALDPSIREEYPRERNCRAVWAFLVYEVGLGEEGARDVLSRLPRLLVLQAPSMRTKVEYLRRWLDVAEVAAAVRAWPTLLTLKRSELKDSVRYLKGDTGLSFNQIRRALLSHPEVLGYAHKMLHAPSVDEGAGQRSRHLAREREAARAKAEIAARKAAALRKV